MCPAEKAIKGKDTVKGKNNSKRKKRKKVFLKICNST